MFSNFRSTIFLGIASSECFSLCLYITPKKTQVWVHKMSYKLVINQFFLQCQVATTLYPPVWNAVCSRLPSCSFMFFFELEKIRNISRLKFTLTIHSLYQFRLVLPLHKNHHTDLQSKSTKWFLYKGNTANPRHQLFQILILTWLKTFFTTFPKFNLARLNSQKLKTTK